MYLSVSAPAAVFDNGIILLPSNATWTLSVEPEQPPVGEAAGSDSNGATITLPGQLVVRSNAAPVVTGSIGISGFGSALSFDTPNGAPGSDGVSVDFPFSVPSSWTIAGNRSAAAQLTAECQATSAAWSLLINNAAPNTFSDAPHGGSVVVQLNGPVSLKLTGVAGGDFRKDAALLSANASRIDFELPRPDASGRIELETLASSPQPHRLRREDNRPRDLFASERDRGDLALVHEGGSIRNRWDLPLTAAGNPFAFEGGLENFAILSRSTGLYVVGVANRESEPHIEGLALENVYLTVQSPNRLAFLGSYDVAPSVPDGTAILSFGVIVAQPILPDPYAASWRLPDHNQVQDAALSVVLNWTAASTPGIVTRLDRRVPFPEPGVGRPDEDERLRGQFDGHLGAHREVLSLLDLSSKEHFFGVALESLSDQEPTLTSNRLTVQQRNVRLLMQPQVLWEPVYAGSVEMTSEMNGARTLLGANTVKLVPVLPGARRSGRARCSAASMPRRCSLSRSGCARSRVSMQASSRICRFQR